MANTWRMLGISLFNDVSMHDTWMHMHAKCEVSNISEFILSSGLRDLYKVGS